MNLESRSASLAGATREYLPTVQLHHALDHRKSHTQAPLRPVDRALALHEQIEHPGQQLRRNPHASVRDLYDGAALRGAQLHADLPAGLGILRGIRQNIADTLNQSHEVAIDKQALRWCGDGNVMLLGMQQRLKSE